MTRKLLANNLNNGVLGKCRKIPTVITLHGDYTAARQFVGYANKLMDDLSLSLGYNNIMAGAAAQKKYTDDSGNTIFLEINYGLSNIDIYVPAGEKEEDFKIVCYPGFKCFIFAIIEKVTCFDPAEVEPECNIDELAVAGECWLYDISFCYIDRYVLLQNYQIRSSGYERYYEGQYVIVGPDAQSSGRCCINGKDLAADVLNESSPKMQHGFLDVYPIHILDDMKKKPLVHIGS